MSSRSARFVVAAAAWSGAALLWCASGSTALACPTAIPNAASIVGLSGHGDCSTACPPTDCGPFETSGAGSGSGGRGDIPFEISMVDFSFLPNAPIVKPNRVVRWNNTGLFQHTTTRLPTWDSGLVNPGQFFDFEFTQTHAGLEYAYDCTIHFGMEGTLGIAHFGDANLDGNVNLNDFNILAANFGQSNRAWETGDFNEDGIVNLNDFNLLAANFGRQIQPALTQISFGPGGMSFVPEPAAAAIALLVPALALIRRRG